MDIKTLIIGYVPLVDATGRKTREIKEDAYMRELLAQYDLGELHYAYMKDWKEKADQIDPLFIILLGNDYYGKEVRAYKNNALLYVTYDAGQVFYRKAETEKRMAKHRTVFKEIKDLIKRSREKGLEEIEVMRTYAAMTYDDVYSMVKKALASKDEKLRHEAWELLFGENVRGDFLWMRINFLADVWEGTDGKGQEELMCLAMEQFVADGMARKLDMFTDEDGQEYHQYMFCDFYGEDLKYIRRIPFGKKGQDRFTYEALLSKNEVPLNFMRVMLEAGQMRELKADHFKKESEKVAKVLAAWKESPTRSRKELGVAPCCKEHGEETPLTDVNIEHLKEFLNEHDPAAFTALF